MGFIMRMREVFNEAGKVVGHQPERSSYKTRGQVWIEPMVRGMFERFEMVRSKVGIFSPEYHDLQIYMDDQIDAILQHLGRLVGLTASRSSDGKVASEEELESALEKADEDFLYVFEQLLLHPERSVFPAISRAARETLLTNPNINRIGNFEIKMDALLCFVDSAERGVDTEECIAAARQKLGELRSHFDFDAQLDSLDPKALDRTLFAECEERIQALEANGATAVANTNG
jgi:hypothetical protein